MYNLESILYRIRQNYGNNSEDEVYKCEENRRE